jgi:hypothetical protein
MRLAMAQGHAQNEFGHVTRFTSDLSLLAHYSRREESFASRRRASR